MVQLPIYIKMGEMNHLGTMYFNIWWNIILIGCTKKQYYFKSIFLLGAHKITDWMPKTTTNHRSSLGFNIFISMYFADSYSMCNQFIWFADLYWSQFINYPHRVHHTEIHRYSIQYNSDAKWDRDTYVRFKSSDTGSTCWTQGNSRTQYMYVSKWGFRGMMIWQFIE